MNKLMVPVLVVFFIAGCIFSVNDDYDKGGGGDKTFTISGSFIDNGGDAIAGMTIVLAGDESAVAVTDGSGAYSFTDLSSGSYTVLPGDTGHGPASVIVGTSDVDLGANSDGHMSQISGNYTCSQCHVH